MGISRTIWDIQKHLKGLWRLQNPVDVSIPGKGFYVLSMSTLKDYMIALAGGPWFLFGHYLAVQKWYPWFKAGQGLLHFMPIWIQLHDLPIELYHPKVLLLIGKFYITLKFYEIKVSFCVKFGKIGYFSNQCDELMEKQKQKEACVLMEENNLEDSVIISTQKNTESQWKNAIAKPFVRRKNQNNQNANRRNSNRGDIVETS